MSQDTLKIPQSAPDNPQAQLHNCPDPQADPAKFSWEDQIDLEFIQRVQAEVTQSCALPFAVPVERIPEYIRQAAQWFWLHDDYSVEERMYVIRNKEFCRGNAFNKIVQLPPQIMSVHGCYKAQDDMRYGAMGDFSLERMMMSSYSMFGGVGSIGGGVTGASGARGFVGYSLTDVVTALYEIDTFRQVLNAPLTYNYNMYTNKLVILGNMGTSDICISCMKRCRIQDLYNNYYFFRLVVCFVKRALSTIYGTFEFRLPGGVQINYSAFKDDADAEIDQIKEWCDENRSADYIFMPGTV